MLTRLPSGRRVRPDLAWKAIASAFPDEPLVLPGKELVVLLNRLSGAAMTGGATYDAMIATTAKHFGYGIVSMDRRATRTYESVGVEFTLLTL